MIHYKQRPNQCVLASICMVQDYNYKLLSKKITTKPNVNDCLRWFNMLCPWAVPSVNDFLKKREVFLKRTWAGYKRAYNKFVEEKEPINLEKLEGKGIIIFQSLNGGHAMGYENGVIYDGNFKREMPYWVWEHQAEFTYPGTLWFYIIPMR